MLMRIQSKGPFSYAKLVLDAQSRKIIGWSMASHLRTELVLDASATVLGQRHPIDVIHRSEIGHPVYVPGVRRALPGGTHAAVDALSG